MNKHSPIAGGRQRKASHKDALSNKMPEAKLQVFCHDRSTGKPYASAMLGHTANEVAG